MPSDSFAALYGDLDNEPSTFQDPSHEPAENSTAAMIGKFVHAQRAEAEHDRNLAQLAQVAADEADDEALDKALDRIRRGRKVSPKMAEAAMRALRADGDLALSSAELLALRSSAYGA